MRKKHVYHDIFYFANHNNKKIAFIINILFISFIFHRKSQILFVHRTFKPLTVLFFQSITQSFHLSPLITFKGTAISFLNY